MNLWRWEVISHRFLDLTISGQPIRHKTIWNFHDRRPTYILLLVQHGPQSITTNMSLCLVPMQSTPNHKIPGSLHSFPNSRLLLQRKSPGYDTILLSKGDKLNQPSGGADLGERRDSWIFVSKEMVWFGPRVHRDNWVDHFKDTVAPQNEPNLDHEKKNGFFFWERL